ncbi:YkoF-like protein [Powellomyces hirtus]|nr:YkoF-like protein [Powellomyces hirtus]
MKVVADFCLIPLGVGTSLTKHVATVQRILADAAADRKINYLMHSCGTNIEGDWDDVMGTIKKCHETLHGPDTLAPRVHTTLRIGTRTDKTASIADKMASVQGELNKQK